MTELQKYAVTDSMRQYISKIRNPEKKDYALRYAIWLMRSKDDRQVIVAPVPFQLGAMAAQAVRMRLNAIAEGQPE